MFIDISLEYNTSHEKFIGKNVIKFIEGDRWISAHTERAVTFLKEKLCKPIEEHKRYLINNKLSREIASEIHDLKYSFIIGGFYTEKL